MGVEYRHFVVPANCELVPSPARVHNLLQKMVARGWLPTELPLVDQPAGALLGSPPTDEDGFVGLMSADFRLTYRMNWPNQEKLRHPFSNDPCQSATIDVLVCYSTRFLSPLSELIDPLQDSASGDEEQPEGLLAKVKGLFMPRRAQLLDLALRCDCGAPIEETSDLFADYVLCFVRCPNCGKAFRPETRRGKLRNGWTNGVQRRPGGLLHRFGLVFDCGKSLPNPTGPGTLTPELAKLISDCLGTSLFEFPDLS